jgi:hypothetical protein
LLAGSENRRTQGISSHRSAEILLCFPLFAFRETLQLGLKPFK